jgi:hypothetical protein
MRQFNSLTIEQYNNKRGLTLAELLIAICIFSLIVIGFSSIDTFSRYHIITSDRRAKLQNDASYALEHMTKNVLQGVGNISQPPLEPIANGFRVRVDLNTPPTPAILTDDTWINYTLSGNTLSCSLNNETLSNFIVSGVVFGQMPSNPDSGFYINFTDNNYTLIEIGLVARYQPNNPISVDNPQITMKTRLYTSGSAAR